MDMVQEGTVKWLSEEKGYSFISSDDGGEDIFVHHTNIEGTGFKFFEEGAKVTYEASQGRKGMQAAYKGWWTTPRGTTTNEPAGAVIVRHPTRTVSPPSKT